MNLNDSKCVANLLQLTTMNWFPSYFPRSSKVLTGPLENTSVPMHGGMDQIPCEVKKQGCAHLSFPELNRTKHAVEPKTGIEFPMILDNILDGEQNCSLDSEVNT